MKYVNIIGASPEFYPVDVHYIAADGTAQGPFRMNDSEGYRKWLELDVPSILGISFSRVSRVEEFMAVRGAYYNPSAIDAMKDFDKWLQQQEEQTNLDDEFAVIDALIDKRLSDKRITISDRRDIRNWFTNPDLYPEVTGRKLWNNAILTTKPSGGGHVVVCPNGHTIAYSVARAFYWTKISKTVKDCHYDFERVKAREYTGDKYSGTRAVTSRVTIHSTHGEIKAVSIGCQKIPVTAIRDLAEREGW